MIKKTSPKKLEYIRKWRKENPDKVKKVHKRWEENNTHKIKNWHYKRTYKITLDEYNQLVKEQNNCCKICGKHRDQFKKDLSVDHNHLTNEIRGLLCFNCNQGLGAFKTDLGIELLEKAIKYIKKELL